MRQQQSADGAQGKPDFSAETVAAARASAAMRYAPPVRNPDHLAKEFLGPRWSAIRVIPPLHAAAVRAWERRAPGIYHYMNARTHYIDDVLARELDGGAQQLVLLGAGYDTRPYRFAERLAGRPVFEVDRGPTLARKRERVGRALGGPPANVTYVDADVTEAGAFEVLERVGFDEARRTLFICEGLSYYLTEAQARALFGAVARRSAPGSAMVYDYLYAEALDGGGGYPGAAEVIRYLEKRGQPYRSGIPEGGLAEWLAPLGHEVVEDLPPAELESRYLRGPDGELVGRAYAAYGIATSRVTGA